MNAEPRLYFLTGIMAAGKSTVAQALAERFDRGVHVRGDVYRRSIVRGREEMSPEPSEEAITQLRLRYRLAAQTADAYVEAGFTTVVQDLSIGPMLAETVAMFRTRPMALIVLCPSVDVVAQREEERAKTGYGSFTPADLDEVLRTRTPRLGLWLDTSGLSVEATVDEIIRRAPDEAMIEEPLNPSG